MSLTRLKSPTANLALTVAFAAVLVSVVAVEIHPLGLVQGGEPLALEGEASASGNTASFALRGGAEGECYDITVRAAYAGGDQAASELRIVALRDDWAMDDGSAGMAGLHAFVMRLGHDETVVATAGDAPGVIDVDWLIGVMRDAQSLVAGELSRRYDLPLPSIPGIVATALCDLAVERLYRRGVPEYAKEKASIARKLMERVGRGDMPLPGVTGRIVQTQASDGGSTVLHDDLGGVSGLADYASGAAFLQDGSR